MASQIREKETPFRIFQALIQSLVGYCVSDCGWSCSMPWWAYAVIDMNSRVRNNMVYITGEVEECI
jgi:hypothetical protein